MRSKNHIDTLNAGRRGAPARTSPAADFLAPVIRAAGGIVTDKTGAPVSMRGTTSLLAAATPELHAEALAIIRGEG